jgi:hypothetical protein
MAAESVVAVASLTIGASGTEANVLIVTPGLDAVVTFARFLAIATNVYPVSELRPLRDLVPQVAAVW